LEIVMPWEPRTVVDKRREFVSLALQPEANVRELARRFRVSARTGHKFINRFRVEGVSGLEDRSRRPLHSPSRSSPRTEERVLEIRARHPSWGGRKIAARMKALGYDEIPAPSTITEILRRNSLLGSGMRGGQSAFTRFEHEHPNALWQMDFKGHFATDTGRCHALTALDDHSRFNLVLEACANEQGKTVQNKLEPVFERFGLPETIITDNGSPWGGGGAQNVWTPFCVWLARLGIRVSHSRPHHPQTLGKDERFHRTLDVELLQGRCFRDLKETQRAFDRFRSIYNHERPHEALGYEPPAKRYTPSPRPFPKTLPEIAYGDDDVVRQVDVNGKLSFRGRAFRIPKAFKGFPVALRPSHDEDGSFTVFFMATPITTLDLTEPA
jgi:transposase InsO family protein